MIDSQLLSATLNSYDNKCETGCDFRITYLFLERQVNCWFNRF